MDIQTPLAAKKLDARTPEYQAERRRKIRPPSNYAVLYVIVNLAALAALWTYAVEAGIRGGAAIVGGVLVTLVQLINVREDTVGESRIFLVSEVLFLVCMATNRTFHPDQPTQPLVGLFVALIALDLGVWTWPFPLSLKKKSWIQP